MSHKRGDERGDMLKTPSPPMDAQSPPGVQQTVPFFRPDLCEDEVNAVVGVLRSGWLTTGPKVREFEHAFGSAVGARHAIALNSCTAALHLGVEALGLQAGQRVLVPTMTFAATAEVVRYVGATPVLIDCDPRTLNLDLERAAEALERAGGRGGDGLRPGGIVGIMPVHVGGMMMDVDAVQALARRYGLWVVEDAAHAFPAAWRRESTAPWQRCGEGTADVTAFSFYANKTITTGEGGMAVTGAEALADRMRLMSLHGLSRDAWDRYRGGRTWDYRIVEAGYKYNLTDIAAAIGVEQVRRAEAMRQQREAIAHVYLRELEGLEDVALPAVDENRLHSWHLFPIRLQLDRLSVDRDRFLDELRDAGIGCSVHWRPLHLHPYYQERFGVRPVDCPVATAEFARLISLPIFSKMSLLEVERVVETVKALLRRFHR